MSNYIKIPDIVRYNQNLKASSKLMFGEIWALSNKAPVTVLQPTVTLAKCMDCQEQLFQIVLVNSKMKVL